MQKEGGKHAQRDVPHQMCVGAAADELMWPITRAGWWGVAAATEVTRRTLQRMPFRLWRMVSRSQQLHPSALPVWLWQTVAVRHLFFPVRPGTRPRASVQACGRAD